MHKDCPSREDKGWGRRRETLDKSSMVVRSEDGEKGGWVLYPLVYSQKGIVNSGRSQKVFLVMRTFHKFFFIILNEIFQLAPSRSKIGKEGRKVNERTSKLGLYGRLGTQQEEGQGFQKGVLPTLESVSDHRQYGYSTRIQFTRGLTSVN